MTNIDIVEAVEYYTTPRGQSVNSPNKLNFTSMGSVIGFDAFHLADTLLTRKRKLLSVASKAHSVLIKMVMSCMRSDFREKDLLVVEGASHYDLYDQPEPVRIAVEKLTSFYKEHL